LPPVRVEVPEKALADLAGERVAAVRRYFVQTGGVAPARIRIASEYDRNGSHVRIFPVPLNGVETKKNEVENGD